MEVATVGGPWHDVETWHTINERKFVQKDTSLPEGSMSRFKSCVCGSSSCASLSNDGLHYEIVCKDCKH
jgi:hypothetical protein